MDLLVKLHEIVAPAVEAVGYELWRCEYISQGHPSILRVYIDSEQGVNIDDCALASHQISAVLDVEDPITGEYNLEVSSPGLERPLFKLEHYQRFIGEQVKVHLGASLNGRKNFSGEIKNVANNIIEFVVDEEVFELPYSSIQKAHLIADMSKL